ncbi:winged helix-turn-helix domain-containing protein [Streptomyces sp. NBC_00237]|uniref:ArsR/SmtB family transcription factor n=1 Tax=Streptomyces sp. NBC_00237 TaxID=2975687 RepID=UPI00225BE79D|nr:winged helix-turn-helix domain-containing protein [Streptomyces sp. NBC_00237]MCX5206931.1 winged helix-turn-helix domain-containing protein [Streptomyces sp. NBC_00237]
MQRIHFTGADLARTRLQSTLGPLFEGVFALGFLTQCQYESSLRWRVDVRNILQRRGSTVDLSALRSVGAPDGLTHLLESPPDKPSRPAPTLGREAGTRMAFDVWRAGVAPYWEGILERLEAVCDAHGQLAATGGVERLLSTLHPRIVWNAPVLEIHHAPERDVYLGGRGLVLKPSVFLPGLPGRVVESARDDNQPVLVFAAAPSITEGWDEAVATDAQGEQNALSSLLGQTRAAALRALRDTSTTTRLAERLGISQGSASQHAAVLREAGLITTRRVRTSALHTVTPLGLALLSGQLRSPATRFGGAQALTASIPAPRGHDSRARAASGRKAGPGTNAA